MAQYDFRNASNDIDIATPAFSVIKEASGAVADKLGLSSDWLNNDFVKTSSFSHKLYERSKHYKDFAQVLSVRVVSDEYLIAMKLKSGRGYKNDASDILGILFENQKRGSAISFDKIEKAISELYGTSEGIDKNLLEFVKSATRSENLEAQYRNAVIQEQENKERILHIGKVPDKDLEGYASAISSDFFKAINDIAQSEESKTHGDIEPDIKNMEAAWHEYFDDANAARNVIPWEGEKLRPAVFEDMYLGKCREAQVNPDEKIRGHFWNNCVKSQGYVPQFCSGETARDSR